MFDLDGWTASVQVESFSERERAEIARNLTGYTTKSDFPVLAPRGVLAFYEQETRADGVRLAKSVFSGDVTRNPIELWYYDKRDELSVIISVTPGPCDRADLYVMQSSDDYFAQERCMGDGYGRVSVEGSSVEFASSLFDELRVQNGRPRPQTVST
jgi:hypothetical protein